LSFSAPTQIEHSDNSPQSAIRIIPLD